jgi:hypothetical protein
MKANDLALFQNVEGLETISNSPIYPIHIYIAISNYLTPDKHSFTEKFCTENNALDNFLRFTDD